MVRSWTCALVLGLLVSLLPQHVHAADTPAEILTELVRLSRELDLPLPPQGAKLVRYEYGAERIANGVDRPIFSLGFLSETGGAKKKMTVLNQTSGDEGWQPQSWHIVEPTSATLKHTHGFSPTILFAVQCQALGWRELAAELLAREQKPVSISARKELLSVAWEYWTRRALEPEINRKPVANMLHKIKTIAPEQTAEYQWEPIIRSLDLALAPSRAKPGSIEALIDSLVDVKLGDGWFEDRLDNARYRQLVRVGFAAVPKLLDHLDDDRLTRSTTDMDIHGSYFHLRVRDLVSDILEKLAGSDEAKNWRRRYAEKYYCLGQAEKEDVLAWWREAQKVGEEAYLVAHAGNPEDTGWIPQQSRRNQIEVIAHKYPESLAKIYQRILDRQPEMESSFIVSAIAGSSLSTEEKTRLLLVGATHKDRSHRLKALSKLKDLGPSQFSDSLVKHIDGIFPKTTTSSGACADRTLVLLAIEADDEVVWQALIRFARRTDALTRLEMFELYDINCLYPRRLLEFLERINSPRLPEFLAVFLSDDAVRELKPKTGLQGVPEPSPAFSSFKKLEVRNGAAMALGRILKMDTEPDENWQPAQWAAYREEVRARLQSKGIKSMTEK